MLPKTVENDKANSAERSGEIDAISSGGREKLSAITFPAVPTTRPNIMPIREKAKRTKYFPATISFLETGITIAYNGQLECSSKEKVVTIIMLHKMAHVKI